MAALAMTENIKALVTTIIPTYRRPELLRRAVNSALEQEGVTVTVRVFDNASGDETGDVITEASRTNPRLRYHCHHQNIGAAANFEFGLRNVDTPFFSILSDDDYLLPGFYRHAMEDLAQHPEAMFWVGLTLNVDELGEIWDARIERWSQTGLIKPPDGLMAMLHGRAPAWTGIVFRSEILERIGFPDREVLGPSDLDFTLKAAASQAFVLRKHPSAVFTLNAASFSATQPMSSFWPGWQKMFQNLAADSALDSHAKVAALIALHQDARRMLFRRGANALALGRRDFARDAAQALQTQYRKQGRSILLHALAKFCEKSPRQQRMYTLAYRAIERRLVKFRPHLEQRYGHLIRRPQNPKTST